MSLLEGYFSADAVPVVRRALGDDDPIVRAAAVAALEVRQPAARLEPAFPLLIDRVRAVRLQAARVLAAVPSEQLSGGQRATLARVLDEYRASQQANADRAEAHLNLGVLHTQLGELDEAERAYRTALDVDPSFVPTYLNLADLYRQQGREGAGEAVLREALAIAADPAPRRTRAGSAVCPTGPTVRCAWGVAACDGAASGAAALCVRVRRGPPIVG